MNDYPEDLQYPTLFKLVMVSLSLILIEYVHGENKRAHMNELEIYYEDNGKVECGITDNGIVCPKKYVLRQGVGKD